MIRKTLLTALGIFAIYNLCLYIPALRQRFIPQSQGQANMVKAQEYLVETRPIRNVLVGSSLAARLEYAMEEDCYNLAFSGGSALTGLEILKRKRLRPRKVYIETNMMMRGLDHALLDNAFRPCFSQLRVLFPAFREKYQPANFLAGKVGEKLVALGVAPLQHLALETSTANSTAGLFDELLRIEKEKFSAPPDGPLLDHRCAQIALLIQQLRRDGTQVVFFEMPVHPSLRDLPLAAGVRARMHATFPPGEYHWVMPSASEEYITTDALHLNGASAEKFAQLLWGNSTRQ